MAAPLIIISGPSGAGKTTTTDHLLARMPSLSRVITVTTRLPRIGERHGVHYFFVSRQTFQELAVTAAFLEINQFGEHLYGTPRSLLTFLTRNNIRLVLPDINGARALKKQVPTAVCIWIEAPAELLAQRLIARNSESAKDQESRLLMAQIEMREARSSGLYEHIIDMTDFGIAEEKIRKIIDTAMRQEPLRKG
ncbi:MAG: guanylate kinase [Candidatus Dependentiae bacterium]|nr:guanylate kinase [Candidatus Dependentiae bacterium]